MDVIACKIGRAPRSIIRLLENVGGSFDTNDPKYYKTTLKLLH
jgi:hypothetical protein